MFNSKRANIIKFIICSMFVIASVKLFYIQIIQNFSKSKDDINWNIKTLKIPGKRGNIYDRNGLLLATDVQSYVMYVDKKKLKSRKYVAEFLERKKIMDQNDFLQRLNETKSRVVIVKKGLKKKDIEQINNIEGIFFMEDWERYYPNKNLLRTVLGKLNFERKGISGIEKQFDKYLSGKDGVGTFILNLKNKYRYITYPDGKNIEPVNGKDIYLTIDLEIQDICDKVARKTLESTNAKNVLCVVIDTETGEILGLADVPEFGEKKEWKKNTFIENEYEPGSIFKIILATLWIIEGKDTSKIVCEKNEKKILNKKMLKDEYDHPAYNFAQAFAYSSNLGFVNIGFELGIKNILNLSRQFGLFSKTGIELPNESEGKPFQEKYKYQIDYANICFGQGFKTTPIQITYAYATFGNNGKLMRPWIVKKITDEKMVLYEGKPIVRRKVLNEKTNNQMIEIMRNVVKYGSGKTANIQEIKIVGKTGTGAQSNKEGYTSEYYLSSFIGIMNPEKNGILIAIFIEEPKGAHKASIVAVPAFKEVAQKILLLKNYKYRVIRSIVYEN